MSATSNRNLYIYTKYGHKLECKACHTKSNLTRDHIIPVYNGGSNKKSNIQILCTVCNRIKGNQHPGKNGWWPDTLTEYLLIGRKPIWNSSKQRYEDECQENT